MPLKILSYLVKRNPNAIDWSNPIIQDNLEFVYHILKEVVKPW